MGNAESIARPIYNIFGWLTEEEIRRRLQLEDRIECLQPQMAAGLDDIVCLRREKRTIEDNKRRIEENASFSYSINILKRVKEYKQGGKHVTNCLNCNVTCHDNCGIPRNEDKHGCVAMGENGHCKVCVDKCHWTSHANTPYIYKIFEETITKTYKDTEEKYRRNQWEEMTVPKLLGRMDENIVDIQITINSKMKEIRDSVNQLRSISRRPKIMDFVQQIDLLIKAEETKREHGYQERVAVLRELRNKY